MPVSAEIDLLAAEVGADVRALLLKPDSPTNTVFVFVDINERDAFGGIADGMLAVDLATEAWVKRESGAWSIKSKNDIMSEALFAAGTPTISEVDALLATPGRFIAYFGDLGSFVSI